MEPQEFVATLAIPGIDTGYRVELLEQIEGVIHSRNVLLPEPSILVLRSAANCTQVLR